MIHYDSISKKLVLIDVLCWFFIKFVEVSVIGFIIFFLYCFIVNDMNYVEIDDNINTIIINPVIKTLNKEDNYTIFSNSGFFVKEGFYKFKDIRIVNSNINIFAKELDFYSNNDEIVLKDRPIIIFSNDNK